MTITATMPTTKRLRRREDHDDEYDDDNGYCQQQLQQQQRHMKITIVETKTRKQHAYIIPNMTTWTFGPRVNRERPSGDSGTALG